MSEYVIVAESGADISAADVERYNLQIVPMHVSFAGETIDDGEISAAEMLEGCRERGEMPRTSGCMPSDFTPVFDRIHAEHPDATILYLAYSSVTTCSYESALTAAKGRDYVVAVDTKHVTAGQDLVVTETARFVLDHPDVAPEQITAFVEDCSARVRMGFIPGDLGFLRAGGRLSNAAFLGAHLLKIKPVVELVDGKLVATRKLRGSMAKATEALMAAMLSADELDTRRIKLIRSPGLSEDIQRSAERIAREYGFEQVEWTDTGNVISSHCGPGTFGMAYLVR